MSTKSTVALLMGATVILMSLPVVGALRARGQASASVATPADVPCEGHVALTFDDGPTPSTQALLGVLSEHGVRATMFNLGVNARRYPDLVRAELDAGHAVENHTQNHLDLTTVGAEAIAAEIADANRALEAAGAAPQWFRPPFGNTNDQVKTALAAAGLREVLWTTDTFDWKAATTDEVIERALAVEPGGIILMHDGQQKTIDALPTILSGLAERGLCAGQIVPSADTHAPAGWHDNRYHAEAGPWTDR